MAKVKDVNELIVSRSDENYLIKCAQEHKFSYGLIIGHTAEANKIVVVHLAKNNEEDMEEQESQTISDINTQVLVHQWVSAYKMCPGSFTVIGVFVAAERPDIVDENSSEFKNVKSKMNEIYNILASCYSEVMDYIHNTDLFFLAYSSRSNVGLCRQYKHSDNGGQLTQAMVKFVLKPFKWHLIECTYQLDDVFPLFNATTDINIEHEYQKTNNKMKAILESSEIFIENEFVDDNLLVCDYSKELENNVKQNDSTMRKSIVATVLTPLKINGTIKDEAEKKVENCKGSIRFKGAIYSRIWCNPKCTIGEVKNYVRTDILRSLFARVQMFCDGLTDPFIKDMKKLYVSEPPRRVFFNLQPNQNAHENIQLCDYIFHGESATVAVAQAKQILDVQILPNSIAVHLENTIDEAMFVDQDLTDDNADKVRVPPTNFLFSLFSTKFYQFGIIFALLVMLISIWIQFFK